MIIPIESAFAAGVVGTAVASPTPVESSNSSPYKGDFISTGTWHQVEDWYWGAWVPGEYIDDPNDINPYSPDDEAYSSWTPRKVYKEGYYPKIYYWKWVIEPGGFHIQEHGTAIIKLKENYVFTKNNVKSNGDVAGLHYEVTFKDLHFTRSDTGERINPINVKNPKVYHKVVRYKNKGIYNLVGKNNIENISVNGAYIKGKCEYSYAGNDDSYFSANIHMKSPKIQYTTADPNNEGKSITLTTQVTKIPFCGGMNIPINAFNSVNYTGSSTRKQDLIFKSPTTTELVYKF